MTHSSQDTIGLALIGYGGIGRLHAMTYGELPFMYPGTLPPPEIRWVCTSREQTAEAGAAEVGAPRWTTDMARVFEDPDVRAVDITLPNHLHADAVIAAVNAGKHVYCEKPLAGTMEEAQRIARAVDAASGVLFAMTFQYRFFPAILRAAELIREGRIGRVFTFRGEYLHSGYQDKNRPLSWRMKREEAGSGALGDLGSHIIDLVRFLLGDFSAVQGHLETLIPRRPVTKGSNEMGTVTVDDVAWIRARLISGAVGTIEASRFATGTLDDLRLWIYGEGGALHFSLMDPNFLWFYDESVAGGEYGGSRGWQRIDTVQHYPGAKAPPGRSPIGWTRGHAENQYRFLRAVVAGAGTSIADETLPGISDGVAVQAVLDATERSFKAGGTWTTVKER